MCVSCVVTVLVAIARHCHIYNNAVTGTVFIKYTGVVAHTV